MQVSSIILDDEIEYYIKISKDYKLLFEQYLKALEHASETKGKERHANNLPFEKQKICRINRDVGLGYGLGQVIKKAEEVVKLSPERAILELCGVINYAAGVMIVLQEIFMLQEKQRFDKYSNKDCDCGVCNYCNGAIVKNGY